MAHGWLHDRLMAEFALFLLTGLGGAAVTSGVVWLVSHLFDAGIHWPKICAVVVSFLFVYFARKRLVFAPRRRTGFASRMPFHAGEGNFSKSWWRSGS